MAILTLNKISSIYGLRKRYTRRNWQWIRYVQGRSFWRWCSKIFIPLRCW